MIEVMSRFNGAEPESVMVVWTDEDGCVCCISNCGHTQSIGMAEYAKALALKTMFEGRD